MYCLDMSNMYYNQKIYIATVHGGSYIARIPIVVYTWISTLMRKAILAPCIYFNM